MGRRRVADNGYIDSGEAGRRHLLASGASTSFAVDSETEKVHFRTIERILVVVQASREDRLIGRARGRGTLAAGSALRRSPV